MFLCELQSLHPFPPIVQTLLKAVNKERKRQLNKNNIDQHPLRHLAAATLEYI